MKIEEAMKADPNLGEKEARRRAVVEEQKEAGNFEEIKKEVKGARDEHFQPIDQVDKQILARFEDETWPDGTLIFGGDEETKLKSIRDLIRSRVEKKNIRFEQQPTENTGKLNGRGGRLWVEVEDVILTFTQYCLLAMGNDHDTHRVEGMVCGHIGGVKTEPKLVEVKYGPNSKLHRESIIMEDNPSPLAPMDCPPPPPPQEPVKELVEEPVDEERKYIVSYKGKVIDIVEARTRFEAIGKSAIANGFEANLSPSLEIKMEEQS